MNSGNYRPGQFVWYELFTDDSEASELFYEGLLGWHPVTNERGRHRYRMLANNDQPVGGVIRLSVEAARTVAPQWLPYVSVPNVDEVEVAALMNGGERLAEARDVADLGRFAVVADPQGAELAVWRSSTGDPPAPDDPVMGAFCWTQLNTPDTAQAEYFYQKLLTWRCGDYPGADDLRVFHCGEAQVASLMRSPAANAQWLSHVLVKDLSWARQRTVELGGEVEVDEIPVQGLGRFAIIRDNVGATVALFEGLERRA